MLGMNWIDVFVSPNIHSIFHSGKILHCAIAEFGLPVMLCTLKIPLVTHFRRL